MQSKGLFFAGPANFLILGSALFTIASWSEAKAQTTQQTCMDMGGGMISCQGMIFSDDAPVSTDGQRELGEAIGKLLFGDREKRFKREVGKMLAEGRCADAAKFAYESGRLSLGREIAESCARSSQPRQVEVTPETLPQALQQMAANARTPFQFDEITTVLEVEAIGKQLLFTALVDTEETEITEEARVQIQNVLCADGLSPSVLGAGGSIRVLFINSDGDNFGAVMITRQACGF